LQTINAFCVAIKQDYMHKRARRQTGIM